MVFSLPPIVTLSFYLCLSVFTVPPVISMDTPKEANDISGMSLDVNHRRAQGLAARVLSLELFDANTDTKVADITPNMVVQSAAPSFNINAVLTGTGAASVKYGFMGNSNYRIENQAPYTFCNCVGTNYDPCPNLGYGTFTVTATTYSLPNAAGTSGVPFSVTFSIVPVGAKSPTRAPTKAPVKSPTRAPTNVPVKPPTRAPTKAPMKPPTRAPTKAPMKSPTRAPTKAPVKSPTRAPTKAPLSAPVDPRAQALTRLVNAWSYSGEILSIPRFNSLTSTSSPQEKALHWLIYVDPLAYTPFSPPFMIPIMQRFALATLYYQTTASPWYNSNGWTNTYECNWYGVTCRRIDHGGDIGIVNTVVSIGLPSNGLQGQIPAELAWLTYLEVLNLSSNALTGPLPSSLGALVNLGLFYVGYNQLSGNLPDTIRAWKRIQLVDIGHNQFTGPLPYSLGSWMNIKTFHADGNMFSGPVPESLALWKKIEWVSIEQNQLTGSIPNEICGPLDLVHITADCNSEVQCICCDVCY